MKIECCGLSSTQIAKIIKEQFPEVEVFEDPDSIAARKVKKGEVDYYLGSCMTGGGGSLATAIAVLGYGNCLVVTRQGNMPTPEKIRHMIYAGKHKAFGYVQSHTEKVVPVIVKALLDRDSGKAE